MKKLLCLSLAALLIFGMVGCTGNGSKSTTTAYSASETLGAGDEALEAFFGGDVQGSIVELAPILFSFVNALHIYPEVLTQTPDSNFGWCYLYSMLAVYDLRPEGVSVKNDVITATAEAVSTLQKNTLGGAIWTAPGEDYASVVSYNMSEGLFTITDTAENPCSFEVTDAAYNAEAELAELTIQITDADKNTASYVIRLRPAEDSAYSYVIFSFSAV